MSHKLWLVLSVSVMLTCVMVLAVHCPMTSSGTRCSSLKWSDWVDEPLRAFTTPALPTLNKTLGFDQIYLIHLQARKDRQQRINALAQNLDLQISVSHAIPARDPVISRIFDHVVEQRREETECWLAASCESVDTSSSRNDLFAEDVYRLQENPERERLGLAGSDLWIETAPAQRPSSNTSYLLNISPGISMHQILIDREEGLNLPLAHYNERPVPTDQSTAVDLTQALSLAVIACWHSHILTLRKFIDSGKESALILEDDIDMEVDIARQMDDVHAVMPAEWDLLFLGHCWGREDYFAPLNPAVPALRPSFAPKCNHAYAVSRRGALRLLRHLRSPAFAYSRPLDQAMVHLIATERLKSFSIFPAIVAQTKDTKSDILTGTGSSWRDVLQHSTLAELGVVPLREKVIR